MGLSETMGETQEEKGNMFSEKSDMPRDVNATGNKI
jgi:hypothetical protein